jgi:hypothetical protein
MDSLVALKLTQGSADLPLATQSAIVAASSEERRACGRYPTLTPGGAASAYQQPMSRRLLGVGGVVYRGLM